MCFANSTGFAIYIAVQSDENLISFKATTDLDGTDFGNTILVDTNMTLYALTDESVEWFSKTYPDLIFF